MNLLLHHGVKTSKIDLHTFVNVLKARKSQRHSTSSPQRHDPTRADADLVVYDPDYRGKICEDAEHEPDYSAFEGWKLEGRPSVVTVRGQVAVRATANSSANTATENSSSVSRVISERVALCRCDNECKSAKILMQIRIQNSVRRLVVAAFCLVLLFRFTRIGFGSD